MSLFHLQNIKTFNAAVWRDDKILQVHQSSNNMNFHQQTIGFLSKIIKRNKINQIQRSIRGTNIGSITVNQPLFQKFSPTTDCTSPNSLAPVSMLLAPVSTLSASFCGDVVCCFFCSSWLRPLPAPSCHHSSTSSRSPSWRHDVHNMTPWINAPNANAISYITQSCI